jgi:hypothetical protein
VHSFLRTDVAIVMYIVMESLIINIASVSASQCQKTATTLTNAFAPAPVPLRRDARYSQHNRIPLAFMAAMVQ